MVLQYVTCLHLLATGALVSSTAPPSLSCGTVDVDLHACTHIRWLLVSRCALLLPVCWLCLIATACSGAVLTSITPLLQWPAQKQQTLVHFSCTGGQRLKALLGSAAMCDTCVWTWNVCATPVTHRQQGRPGQSCRWSCTCTWYMVLSGLVVNCDQKGDSKTHDNVESDTGSKMSTHVNLNVPSAGRPWKQHSKAVC
jgi:hypothetical protein